MRTAIPHQRLSCDAGDDEQPAERERDEELPAEVHELVVAHAWEGRPHPDVGSRGRRGSCRRTTGSARASAAKWKPGPSGPAEEQRHDDGRHRDGVHEFGEEEQGETHRGVLGVEAADELLLALGQVERRTLQLGGDGDDEDDERHDARCGRRSSARRSTPACRRSSESRASGSAGSRRRSTRPIAAS